MREVLVIVFLTPILLAGLVMFDRLVMLQYKFYRRDWEADGRPHAFFWLPEEIKNGRVGKLKRGSSSASWYCSFVWLFSTPSWARQDAKARKLLFWFRVLAT